jgi:hypothetical protein
VQFIGLNTPYFNVYFTSGCVFAFNKSKGRFPSLCVMKWNINVNMYGGQCQYRLPYWVIVSCNAIVGILTAVWIRLFFTSYGNYITFVPHVLWYCVCGVSRLTVRLGWIVTEYGLWNCIIVMPEILWPLKG